MHFFSPRRAAAPAAALLFAAALSIAACMDRGDGGLVDRLSIIEERIVELRGIQAEETVEYRFVSQQEMSDYLAESLNDEETLKEILHAEAVYLLLGLMPQDSSLRDLYGDLLDQQVLGAYDSETKEFVVLQTGEEFGALEETTYAHEYVHYLQDTRFGLEALRDRANDNDDFSLAITSLVEGDATSAQTQYMFRHISASGLGEILQGAGPSLDAAQQAPYVLQRGLEFPYVEGAAFVNQLKSQGGQDRVDEAFDKLPQSTEQVIRIGKYFEAEPPLTVQLPDNLFGEGWTEDRSNVLGQFFLQTWLEALSASRQNAQAASWGWGGDEYALYEGDDGRQAFGAVIAWDEPENDSTEFAEVLSFSLDQVEEFERLEGGIPGALAIWNGPGGVLGMIRMADPEHGAAIGIVVAPDREQVVPALAKLAGLG